MLKFSATLSLAFLAASTAYGADMPIKAPLQRVNPFINYGTGIGWYVFVGGFGEEADITASGTRLSATGGGVSGGVGAMKGFGTTWAAADLRVNLATTSATTNGCTAGALTACDFKRNISIEGRIKYGADSSVLANILPNFGLSGLSNVLPIMPDNTLTPVHPEVFGWGRVSQNKTDVTMAAVGAPVLGFDFKNTKFDYGLGIGLLHQIDSRKVMEITAKCGLSAGSTQIDIITRTSVKLGSSCSGGVDIIF